MVRFFNKQKLRAAERLARRLYGGVAQNFFERALELADCQDMCPNCGLVNTPAFWPREDTALYLCTTCGATWTCLWDRVVAAANRALTSKARAAVRRRLQEEQRGAVKPRRTCATTCCSARAVSCKPSVGGSLLSASR